MNPVSVARDVPIGGKLHGPDPKSLTAAEILAGSWDDVNGRKSSTLQSDFLNE